MQQKYGSTADDYADAYALEVCIGLVTSAASWQRKIVGATAPTGAHADESLQQLVALAKRCAAGGVTGDDAPWPHADAEDELASAAGSSSERVLLLAPGCPYVTSNTMLQDVAMERVQDCPWAAAAVCGALATRVTPHVYNAARQQALAALEAHAAAATADAGAHK